MRLKITMKLEGIKKYVNRVRFKPKLEPKFVAYLQRIFIKKSNELI